MDLQLQRRTVAGITVLDVAGELDAFTSPKLKAAFQELLDQGQARLVVNLLRTTYIDSTALTALTTALAQAREEDGNLVLVFNQPQLEKIFTITRLRELFAVFPSEDDALAAVQQWAVVPPPV